MHPDLKRPSLVDKQPMYTDISHFEDYPEFIEIREDILRYAHEIIFYSSWTGFSRFVLFYKESV